MPKNKTIASKLPNQSKKKLPSKKGAKVVTKKTAPADGGIKSEKKHRRKAGTNALREIRRYQK